MAGSESHGEGPARSIRAATATATATASTVAISVLALVAIAAAVATPLAIVGGRRAAVPAPPNRAEALPTTLGAATRPPATLVADFGVNGPDLWVTTPDGRLYVSTDSATTWTEVRTPVPLEGSVQMTTAPATPYALDPYGATVFGETVWLVVPGHGGPTLFESGDAGKGWSPPLPVPAAAPNDDVSVQLLNTQDAFVVVEPRTGGRPGSLDRSTDGGSRFSTTALPARGAVHFDSTTVGFLVSATGRRLYRTTDGGVSWRRLTARPPEDHGSGYRIGFPLGVTSSWTVVPVTTTGTRSVFTVAAYPGKKPHVLGHLEGPRDPVLAGTSNRVFSGKGETSYSFLEGWAKWTTTTRRGVAAPAGWAVSAAISTATGEWVVSEARRSCRSAAACTYRQRLYLDTFTKWRPIVLGAPVLHPPGTAAVPRLQTVAFVTPTTGYGGFTGRCTLRVAKTTDGGRLYTSPVPIGSCSPIGQPGSLVSDRSGDGFAYSRDSPLLYESHDRGTTWRSELEPGDVLSVEVVGRSVWLLVADCSPAQESISGATTCPLTVRESTDGGRTWRTSPAQPQRVPPPPLRVHQTPSMTRVNRLTAFVSGTAGTNGHAKPSTVPLWFTDDGGRSWTRRRVDCGLDATSSGVSAAPTGTLFAVCAGQPGLGNQEKSVEVSTDDGVSWKRPGPCTYPSIGQCATAGVGGGYFGQVDAVSSSAAYVVGDRSPLYETTDGGATWGSARGPDDEVGGPAEVQFFDADDGVALVSTSLWHTDDAGATWSAVAPRLEP